MEYIRLKNTGLEVSKLALGCMELGEVDQYPWHLNEQEGIEYIHHALDLGINFFDTADVYSHGQSEVILGKALKKCANRDEVVIATKVFYPLNDHLNGRGLSRKHIFDAVEASLKRLQTDYIDLYIIHRFDYQTPIEETMEVLNDLIKMGKIRYIGASAMYAWQFSKAQYIAKLNGWHQFITMQNHYNLLYREDEREMIPLCNDLQVTLTPYSPLAGGRLCHDASSKTLRSQFDQSVKDKYDATATIDQLIIDRVANLAKQKNTTQAKIAMSWLLNKDNVIPIVGGSKFKHVEEAAEAIKIKLSKEEIKYLEECYQPHPIVGAL